MTYQPGQEGFNPLTEEQFNYQTDLFGRRQDYSDFSNMASDVTGMGGGIGGLWKRQQSLGGDARFGHAYEDWQDYAAGYGGSDPSQGMENWMQDYNFDLAPQGPEFSSFMEDYRAENPMSDTQGVGLIGPQSAFSAYSQAQEDFRNTPEYLEWKQREEARGPLSASTTQAIGLQPFDAAPDISPYISMGMGAGQDPTYENYLSNIERLKTERENYVPQSAGGIQGTSNNPLSQSIGAGISGLAAYQRLGFTGGPNPVQPALGGPTQKKIQQGIGALA